MDENVRRLRRRETDRLSQGRQQALRLGWLL